MKPLRATLVLILLLHTPLAHAQVSADAVTTFLRENIDPQKHPSGIVIGIVDESGSTIISRGHTAGPTPREVDGDTVFEIGSITKTFTVLLLQDMVDRGEMNLDDPVAKYLPDSVRMPARGDRQITLLDLATHMSGLPRDVDHVSAPLPQNPFADYPVEKLYATLSNHTLRRDPGAQYEYSNLGSGLLGHVIALKAKTDYETLVLERICRPLGMESTRITLTPQLKSRMASGHDTSGKPAPNWDLGVLAPAGGIRSTANDLLKYAAAHAGLTRSNLAPAMQKTHVIRCRDAAVPGQEGFTANAAMTWTDYGIVQPPGTQLLGHGGGSGGYSAFVGFDAKQRRAVVVLSNQSGGPADLHPGGIGWCLLLGLPLTREAIKTVYLRGREIVGIGTALELDPQTKMPRITKVLDNSPAAKAGLSAGVILKKIDDTPTAGKTLGEVVALLRGVSGTKVRLELVNPEIDRTSEVELTRQKIQL